MSTMNLVTRNLTHVPADLSDVERTSLKETVDGESRRSTPRFLRTGVSESRRDGGVRQKGQNVELETSTPQQRGSLNWRRS